MFGDSPNNSSQMTSQAQAMLANQIPGYNSLFQNNFGGLPRSGATAEGSSNGENIEETHNAASMISKLSNSSASNSQNINEENPRLVAEVIASFSRI